MLEHRNRSTNPKEVKIEDSVIVLSMNAFFSPSNFSMISSKSEIKSMISTFLAEPSRDNLS
jgi:hypothetical protein